MQEYISKQQQILRPAEQIYAAISRFDNLTPALADRVEERVEAKHVKIVGDEGGVPVDFAFWIQLHEVSAADTRLRIVLHAELNMMMKMMIGSKLQGAVDQIAEGIAKAMNGQF